jgi:hypothetical protein
VNAEEIAKNPEFMSPPGATPLYCRPDEPMRDLPYRSNKIYWVVYGKDVHKAAVSAAVRKVVQETGTEVPVEHEGKDYTTSVLKRIIAKEPGAQVLGAEIKKDGTVEVFLYDGPTELIESQKVECAGCDKDTLAEKVKQTTTLVLSHCFGESCARVGRSRAPAEACRPFEVLRCEGLPEESIPLVPTAPDASSSSNAASALTVSPGIAKLTKGLIWGVFAAGAATTAGLLAANYAGAGQLSSNKTIGHDILLPAAGAVGGVSLLILGAALPLTIVMDRATAQRHQSAVSSASATPPVIGSLSLQCPN